MLARIRLSVLSAATCGFIALGPPPATAAGKTPAVRKPPPAAPAKAAPAKQAPASPDKELVISEGKEAILVDHLKAEGPTVVLFYRPANPDEADMAEALKRRSEADPRVALRFVRLASPDAPIARQYEIAATPQALVYDRNKNLVGRGASPEEIAPFVARALRTARIKWIDEGDPKAAEVYRQFGGGTRRVPEIMKTMSLRPEIMESINALSRYHFSDGFLPRRTHEMIASYVSAVNRCKY